MTTLRCLFRVFGFLGLICLPMAAAGCGKASMVPVQGKITYRNYPVMNGLIVFTPDPTHTRGPMAVGRIREDGSFSLFTGENPGAYPGQYRVTVCSLAPGSSSESWGRFEYPRSALPDKYRDPEQSQLVCEVKSQRANAFDVELTD